MTTVIVRGLKELDAKLTQLSQVAAQKAMRNAIFAASKPILDQAKANAAAWPKGSGAIKESLTRTYSKGLLDTGTKFTVSVGPKAKNRTAIALYNLVYKRRRPIRGIYYGHLLEFGHKDRAGGDVAAKPFLLPALESKKDEATQILADKLRQNIEKALK